MSVHFERLRARVEDLVGQAHEVVNSVDGIVEDGLNLVDEVVESPNSFFGLAAKLFGFPVNDESPVEDGPVVGILPNVGEWFNDGDYFWARCSKITEDKVYYDVCASAYSYISCTDAPYFTKEEFESGGRIEAIVEYNDLPPDVRAMVEKSEGVRPNGPVAEEHPNPGGSTNLTTLLKTINNYLVEEGYNNEVDGDRINGMAIAGDFFYYMKNRG